MTYQILVLGEPPSADLKTLRGAAKHVGASVTGVRPGDGEFTNGEDVSVGYVSFLPCKRTSIVEFLSTMQVGENQNIPLFQCVKSEAIPGFLADLPVLGIFRSPLSSLDARNMVATMLRLRSSSQHNASLWGEVTRYRGELNRLIHMGTLLSQENSLDSLLDLILAESRDILCADAGSIYIRERTGPTGVLSNRIRFKVSQNDSVGVGAKSREFTIPMTDSSISGYVALTGKLVTIEDVYRLDESVPYRWSRGNDRLFGYRTRSMVTVPLKNIGGDVVGVLQLMNKKRRKNVSLSSPAAVEEWVTSFSHTDEDTVRSIASLAAVSIERAALNQQIQEIFEGLLSSSAAAIDERDQVTSGHSKRVAGYAMAFINALNAATDGVFGTITFSEERTRQFKFAALLHDIGKIGVPEAILTKECRLTRGELATVRSRVDYIKLRMVTDKEGFAWPNERALDDDFAFVERINTSGFLSDSDVARLEAIRGKTYIDPTSGTRPFLSNEEWEHLSVRRGNLTVREREIINSHALATRRILSKIPWTPDLEQIPTIACHHHERLDGSGYPDGLKGDSLGLESRILAVVDIYEALVAQDRPYKPRMPSEKALDILRAEARSGHLDESIVDFFIEKKIYRLYLDEIGE